MKLTRLITITLALAALVVPAFAHPGHLETQGLASGFLHPLSGIDHILVMIAVGVMAAQMGGRGLYLLPASFLAMMVLGGGYGMIGFGLPLVEVMIALSVLVMGVGVAMHWRLPVALAMAVVGGFAVFHGFAHGAEMPRAASGFGYGAGFVFATAALHLVGVALGFALQSLPRLQRASGVLMTAAGVGLLAGWM